MNELKVVILHSAALQLRTCIIRPAAIYGPGERRHTLRIFRMARQGLLQFVFGSPQCLVDFVSCDNLCRGLIQASEGLSVEKKAVAGGQVCDCVSDVGLNKL